MDDPTTHDAVNPDLADLEPSPEVMAALGRQTLDKVLAHVAGVETMPVRGDMDATALCRELEAQGPPEHARPLDALLETVVDQCVPRSFTTISPGYLAFVPGGGLYSAALADLVSNVTNRYSGVWAAAPAMIQLESNVLRWLADWMGYPSEARGLLSTGGSLANLAAIVTAREERLGPDIRPGVIYTTTETHHCVAKAARLAGVQPDRVRALKPDGRFRMDVDVLQAAIADDRRAGLRPFLVVSSAGTTNTGAVDPLRAIGEVCKREGLWHHCDGAYGAFFHMVPELRALLPGLDETDSLTLDPHKGLFLPYGTGAVLVRDGEALRRAHAATADYLPPPADAFYDPSQYGPELSRDFRGLRLWLPFQLHGVARFREALAEKRELAVDCARRLAEIPGLVLDAEPELSLFPFHVEWPGSSVAEQSDASRELMERVTARGRVMVTGAEVGGRYLGRVCVLCFRTHARHIDMAVDDFAAATAELLAERGVGA